MNKAYFGISLTLVVPILLFSSTPSLGAPSMSQAKFANCTELNKVYPGGVAKNSKVRNKGGKTKVVPSVKPAIYKKNASKDRDKDGIACEK